ncbi:MAG TPA: cytochrome c oxidase subunit II [Pirellulales bacterium]|nr:cytochrome c oxidase subunit II [Pirellulales bacterium]
MNEITFFPDQASTGAQAVDWLLLFLSLVCGGVGLLVAGLLLYFSIKYRRRPGSTATPPATRHSHALEWFWTLATLPAFACMFLGGAKVYLDAFHAPADAAVVYVVGKQWMWKFQHPEGEREINMLHVPVGSAVKLLLTSEDVIHSFFVPAFRLHMDVLPNRFTSAWFEATREGEFHLFCSQYCGTSHSKMIGTIVVMRPDRYQAWLSSSAEGSLALEGRKVFLKYRCLSCHSADENARAPVLESVFGHLAPLRDGKSAMVDENYLRESILHPAVQVVAGYEPIMPTFEGLIDTEEVVALIAYLKSLRPGETPRRVESFPPPVRVDNPAAPDLPEGAEPRGDRSARP